MMLRTQVLRSHKDFLQRSPARRNCGQTIAGNIQIGAPIFPRELPQDLCSRHWTQRLVGVFGIPAVWKRGGDVSQESNWRCETKDQGTN